MPDADPELHGLFLAQCEKLAALTAALGFPGDEPTEKLVALARDLRRDAESIRKLRRHFGDKIELNP